MKKHLTLFLIVFLILIGLVVVLVLINSANLNTSPTEEPENTVVVEDKIVLEPPPGYEPPQNNAVKDPDWRKLESSACNVRSYHLPTWRQRPTLSPVTNQYTDFVITSYLEEFEKEGNSWVKIEVLCINKSEAEPLSELLSRINSSNTGADLEEPVASIVNQGELEVEGFESYQQTFVPVVGEQVLEYYIMTTPTTVLNLKVTPVATDFSQEVSEFVNGLQSIY